MEKARMLQMNAACGLLISEYPIGKSLTTCTGWSRIVETTAKVAAQ
jgi:hypothetical protein